MKSVALKIRLARTTSLKKKGVQKGYVSKQGRKFVKSFKGEPSIHKDLAFDNLDDIVDDAMDYMEYNTSCFRLASAAICKNGGVTDWYQSHGYREQAYDAIPPPQAIIALLAVLPLSSVLSLPPMFYSRDFFPPEKISPPKDTETSVKSPISVSPSSSVGSSSPVRSTTSPPDYPFDKSIFAELDNSLWIIPRPLGEEPVLEESNELDTCQKVHL
ncbi:hypothetical protein Tco_0831651 [Tanacetum coccineum]